MAILSKKIQLLLNYIYMKVIGLVEHKIHSFVLSHSLIYICKFCCINSSNEFKWLIFVYVIYQVIYVHLCIDYDWNIKK